MHIDCKAALGQVLGSVEQELDGIRLAMQDALVGAAPRELSAQEATIFTELETWIRLKVENEQAWLPLGDAARAHNSPCLEPNSVLLAALSLDLAQQQQDWVGTLAKPSTIPTSTCDAVLCASAAVALTAKKGICGAETTQILDQWLMANFTHPYPNELETKELCSSTGLTPTQISTWFANARKRKWRPKIEKLFYSHCVAP